MSIHPTVKWPLRPPLSIKNLISLHRSALTIADKEPWGRWKRAVILLALGEIFWHRIWRISLMIMVLLPRLFSLALLLSLLARVQAEIIYDNTQFILSGYAVESREYGDQVDLEGTARTITEITFFYFGDFVSDGDEGMKVRLYTNETPFDRFRNAPTKMIYESGTMPLKQGYNSRTLENLNVKAPGNSLTFTIEFKGLAPAEIAGLLLYNPPTVGASFNEFWGKTPTGAWTPFFYSTTDLDRKANAGLKLVARADAVVSGAQTNSAAAITLRGEVANYRVAQTFKPSNSGRLENVSLGLEPGGSAVRLSILETSAGTPGNEIGSLIVQPDAEGKAQANFYSQSIFLGSGSLYALQVEATNAPVGEAEERVLVALDNPYPAGQLWVTTNSPQASWQVANVDTSTNVDAAFSISIVPGAPNVRITSPEPGASIPYGRVVTIGIATNLPAISTIYRVRFFDGNQELEQIFRPPYEAKWHATNSGPHSIRVIVEETFGRQFRAEPHLVTVLEAPPQPIERRVAVQNGNDGAVTLTFGSESGEQIQVEYSDDLLAWKNAGTSVTGSGAEVTFTDDGPPQTDKHPKETVHRYYRVRFE